MTDITRDDHDRCLAACHNHKADLSTEEFSLLNLVASAWICSEHDWLTPAQIGKARRIINRVSPDPETEEAQRILERGRNA